MSIALEVIDHGESREDEKINSNFKKLNQDTGWIDLGLVGSVKGMYRDEVPRCRMVNGVVQFTGGISATDDIPANTLVVSVPANFASASGSVNTAIRASNTAGTFPIYANSKGINISLALKNGDGLDFSGLIYQG